MTKMRWGAGWLLAVMAVAPAVAVAQDGSDINQAIPIYFGQTINDVIDRSTKQWQVYSLQLAKGQSITVFAKLKTSGASFSLFLAGPASKQLAQFTNCNQYLSWYCGATNDTSINYQVATAGTYYVAIKADTTGINYTLQVAAQGTPIAVPNPPTAGCLTGTVDYVTYSLQLIAAGLPDEISIGGTKACPSCAVKAPLYPEMVSRLEQALLFNVSVKACYDATGNLFQLTLSNQ